MKGQTIRLDTADTRIVDRRYMAKGNELREDTIVGVVDGEFPNGVRLSTALGDVDVFYPFTYEVLADA